MFQAFQLTAFVIRGPATRGERPITNLDRVAMKDEEVRGVLLGVQGFFRSLHVTQRSFLAESGLTMLSESLAVADSIKSSSVYAPWSLVVNACAGQVMSDMCSRRDQVVLHCRTANDTSDRWHHGDTPLSETASWPRVLISDVVGELCVEYAPNASPALGPRASSKNSSSLNRRNRIIFQNPVKFTRKLKIFSRLASSRKQSLAEDPSFESALTVQASRGKSGRSGRDRATPVFQRDWS